MLVERRPDALLIGGDPFFFEKIEEILTRVARLRLPTIYPFRQFAESGGLISYGINIVICIVRSAFIRVVFSKVLSLPTYQSCSRPRWNWLSTSRQRRCLVLTSHPSFMLALIM